MMKVEATTNNMVEVKVATSYWNHPLRLSDIIINIIVSVALKIYLHRAHLSHDDKVSNINENVTSCTV